MILLIFKWIAFLNSLIICYQEHIPFSIESDGNIYFFNFICLCYVTISSITMIIQRRMMEQ
jgi:hypothetical protein